MTLIAESSGWSDQIRISLQQSMTEFWTKVAGFIPNLIGALIILIVGFVVSKLLQRAATAILRRAYFDKASEKTGLTAAMQKVGARRTASDILGVFVFWLFMLMFLISAAETLGLENVSRTIDSFVTYLPNVIGAALIVVAGLLVCGFIRTAAEAALQRIGFEYAKPVAKLIYGVLIVVIASLAIGQLQIETRLLNRVIEIIVIAVGASLALALGFGTRDVARNVIAGVYARESFRAGAQLSLDECEGTVEAVTAVNTRIRTEAGEIIYVPNAQLIETRVRERAPPA